MSGSSRVELTSEYFHLSTESACRNFDFNPEDPEYETRWHREWKEEAAAWLERVKPVLEHRFSMLAARPDPEWPLAKYDERFPLWSPDGDPKEPPPWRVEFPGMSGPGSTQLTVVFTVMPSEEARERFKRELVKEGAFVASIGGGEGAAPQAS